MTTSEILSVIAIFVGGMSLGYTLGMRKGFREGIACSTVAITRMMVNSVAQVEKAKKDASTQEELYKNPEK
jgi:hypothetical protein